MHSKNSCLCLKGHTDSSVSAQTEQLNTLFLWWTPLRICFWFEHEKLSHHHHFRLYVLFIFSMYILNNPVQNTFMCRTGQTSKHAQVWNIKGGKEHSIYHVNSTVHTKQQKPCSTVLTKWPSTMIQVQLGLWKCYYMLWDFWKPVPRYNLLNIFTNATTTAVIHCSWYKYS